MSADTADLDQIPFSSIYCMVAKTVDIFMKALQRDMLPDEATEQLLGMSGEEGHRLYCAFQKLGCQGRISRTMLQQAMCYTPTSYKESIALWIRSLAPGERNSSRYAAILIQSKFEKLPWNTDPTFPNFFNKVGTLGKDDENSNSPSQIRRIQPVEPLGDNRHDPRPAKAARVAKEFYNLFKFGRLFQGPESLPDLQSDDEADTSLDVLRHFGSLFGIDSPEIPWEDGGGGFPLRIMPEVMTVSELMLRTWNALYFCQRLSLTELECALIQGTMKDFLTRAVTIALGAAYDNKPFAEHGRTLFFSVIDFLQGDNRNLQGETAPEDFQLVFRELTVEESIDESCLECDYCNSTLEKSQQCSQCKTAMYCNRDCQKKDWVRHKPLCSRYISH